MYVIAYGSIASIAGWRIKNSDCRDRDREAYGVRRGLAALHTIVGSNRLSFNSEAPITKSLRYCCHTVRLDLPLL